MFGECVWYKMPQNSEENVLGERWSSSLWFGKSFRSDEHILCLGNDIREARSVRRKSQGSRWNNKMLSSALVTPWKPRLEPTTPVQKQWPAQYITKTLIEQHGASPGCNGCAGSVPKHSVSCRQRFNAIFMLQSHEAAGLNVVTEPVPRTQNAAAATTEPGSSSTQPTLRTQTVEDTTASTPPAMEAMEAHSRPTPMETESSSSTAAVSRNPAPVDAEDPSNLPFRAKRALYDDNAMEDETTLAPEPASQNPRVVGNLSVCSLHAPLSGPENAKEAPVVTPSSIPCCYVATADVGKKPVIDCRTGEIWF